MGLIKNSQIVFKVFGLFIVLMGLSSCQNNPLEVVRSVTYEPEFHYISNKKWSNTMRQFEVNLGILERSLGDSMTMNADQRKSAYSILNKLDELSLDLSLETLNTHQDFSLFRHAIKTARTSLMQTPPSYEQIKSISMYCTNCHAKARNLKNG